MTPPSLEPPGSEKPTIVERLIIAIPLPYAVSCLLLGLFLGPLGVLLFVYAGTVDWELAIYYATGTFGITGPAWAGFAYATLVFAVIFYAFYIIRWMRLAVEAAEARVAPLLSGGEPAFHAAFARVFRWRNQAIVIPFFVALAIPAIILSTGLPLAGQIDFAISTLLVAAALGTSVWLYAGSVLGLERLGKGSLSLKPFYEDRMLGLRPFGTLSISLATAFSVGVALAALFSAFAPVTGLRRSEVLLLWTGLIAFGIVMFLLPLRQVHRRMIQAKRQSLDGIRLELKEIMGSRDGSASSAEDLLKTIREILRVDLADRKIATIPTWPFDATILRWFAVVTTSVVAILAARVVAVTLGL